MKLRKGMSKGEPERLTAERVIFKIQEHYDGPGCHSLSSDWLARYRAQEIVAAAEAQRVKTAGLYSNGWNACIDAIKGATNDK